MTGLVRGDLFVRDNSLCDVTGMVSGNLLAERTGKAVLHGLVTKAAKSAGGDLEIYGMVQGDVINEGGRLFVDKGAVVRGKVIGQTHTTAIPPPEKVTTPPATSPPGAPTPAPKPPAPPTP
jgi:cytoskeletal protein CcmA (bactofilin family)